MIAIIDPNDESTLTSISGSTPVPTDNAAAVEEENGLLKFPPSHTSCMSDSFVQGGQPEPDTEGSCLHTELTGSISDSNDLDGESDSSCLVPNEVTVSFCDKSFEGDELPSPIPRRRKDQRKATESLDDSVLWDDADEQLCRTLNSNTSEKDAHQKREFISLRATYLIVTLVIMLADGLQGTHLYVLYEGYGFSVASLYCLGFATGAFASPITGPLVDRLGRKKSAILYCLLEISINMLEQHNWLPGLIISRMVGGVTTNLLSTVFDAWLDTEYRRRGLAKEGYEIIMRDSVIVSNLAAIGSGYLAHVLAKQFGPVGPFEGAVTFTAIALIVVMFVWTENYGCGDDQQMKGMGEFLGDAVNAFKRDKRIFRVGIIQGMTCASIQIFIFLWSPALRHFAKCAPEGTLGLDSEGEPAYGLIFGAFMGAGVMGGLVAPSVRRLATRLLSPITGPGAITVEVEVDGIEKVRPMAVEVLSATCYIFSALLLLAPHVLAEEGTHSFSICLASFLIYEFMVGLYLPCEGVIRSIYFPAEGRASIMTLPRIIVNCGVSVGVVLTTLITMRSAFLSIVILMIASAGLQLSLVSTKQLTTLQRRLSWSPSALQAPPQTVANSSEQQKAHFFRRLNSGPSCSSLSSDSSGQYLSGNGKLKSQ